MQDKQLNDENLRLDAKIPIDVISQIYAGYNIDKQYIFRLQKYLGIEILEFMDGKKDEEELLPQEKKKRRDPRPVWKCDLRHNHLKKYKHADRAGEILGRDPAPIYRCLNGEQKKAYGFIWEFADVLM